MADTDKWVLNVEFSDTDKIYTLETANKYLDRDIIVSVPGYVCHQVVSSSTEPSYEDNLIWIQPATEGSTDFDV